LVPPHARRQRLLAKLKTMARRLEHGQAVRRARVFRAIVRPPTARFSAYLRERGRAAPVADFDVLVLIETDSPASARDVRRSTDYQALLDALRAESDSVHLMLARNGKRITDVDTEHGGLFLFNHFLAADADTMRALWDYLAGWYVAETGLDNSVALVPAEGESSPYQIVNWARWNERPILHFWHQLSKRELLELRCGQLDANHAGSMPNCCRLA
jgi:hypothetical protein